MKKKLIIFGTGNLAQLAHFYFMTDSDYEVVAFTLDSAYITEPFFCKLPVVAFEKLIQHYPPEQYDLFIAIGYSKINAIRKEKYLMAKVMGYRLASFISSSATILNDRNIGENCFIFENVILEPSVLIGNNIFLWVGVHIAHHSVIKDHCFLAPDVSISGCTEIGEQCFIGINATLRDHIKIGERCIIGAGALILDDTEPEGLYIGAATPRSALPSTQLKKI